VVADGAERARGREELAEERAARRRGRGHARGGEMPGVERGAEREVGGPTSDKEKGEGFSAKRGPAAEGGGVQNGRRRLVGF
jgi:hypothetical protein